MRRTRYRVLSAIVGLCGGGFLAAALYLALIPLATPLGAAALTGVALLALTGVLLLISSAFLRPWKLASAPSGSARSETEADSDLVAASCPTCVAGPPHRRSRPRNLPAALGTSQEKAGSPGGWRPFTKPTLIGPKPG